MADIVDSEVRSRMMANVKSKNSTPEIKVRKILHASGFRFRLHRRDLPGSPDIVLPKRRVVIFVHGCFWHAHRQCRYAKIPETRADFWKKKFQRNLERDVRAVDELQEKGWRVLYVWECAIRDKKNPVQLDRELISFINSEEMFKELSSIEK